MIEVYDTLCSDIYLSLRQDVSNLMASPIWQYGWKSAKSQMGVFWNREFVGKKYTLPQPEELSEFSRMWYEIDSLWRTIRADVIPRMENLVLSRAYANAYTYGTGGDIHVDDSQYTILYYAAPEWDQNWNGETLFFPHEEKPVCVEYKPGRVVVFDGSIPHQGREVSRFCRDLRTIVAFKCITY